MIGATIVPGKRVLLRRFGQDWHLEGALGVIAKPEQLTNDGAHVVFDLPEAYYVFRILTELGRHDLSCLYIARVAKEN